MHALKHLKVSPQHINNNLGSLADYHNILRKIASTAMQTLQSPKKGRAGPRARKSIAHMPTQGVNGDKENITVDIAAATVAVSNSIAQEKPLAKKPRSKSIGPGGLDALKEDTGNRRQVLDHHSYPNLASS